MGIKVLKRDNGEGCNCITQYLCDTTADVADIPVGECAAGSTVIVAEPDTGSPRILILNTRGEWK